MDSKIQNAEEKSQAATLIEEELERAAVDREILSRDLYSDLKDWVKTSSQPKLHENFYITEEDVAASIRSDPDHCPIATALRRHYRLQSCKVFNSTVRIVTEDGEEEEMELENDMRERIATYDKTGVFPPTQVFTNPSWTRPVLSPECEITRPTE